MSNLHALPDTLHELFCTWGDLGPAVILSHAGLTVPASSLTLAALSAQGYVLAPGPPARLVYVSQPAVSLTLSGGNGTYWLGLHADLSTAVAGWTRRAGSHFVWQMNATQPANPAATLVWGQVTVAGGVISAVTPLLPVTSPPLSKQNSNAVAITGGTATLASAVVTGALSVDSPTFVIDAVNDRVTLGGTNTKLILGALIGLFARQEISFDKNAGHAIVFRPTAGTDAGTGANCLFLNVAGTGVGSILTTATATSFNTSSDARLKHAVQALTDTLERVRALRPVSFRWQADDSPGVGFLAHELMLQVPEAVTGLPEAVDEQGKIVPQQIDQSRLVPHLTAAIQELLTMVEGLTARVTSLEEALGV